MISQIFSSKNDLSYLLSNNGIITDVGNCFLQMTGYIKEDFLHKTISDIFNLLLRCTVNICDLDDHKEHMEAFIVTKTLKARKIVISLDHGSNPNEIIYTITENLKFRCENRFLFIEQLYKDNIVGVAIHSIPELILLKANQKYLDYQNFPYNDIENCIGKSFGERVNKFEGSKAEAVFKEIIRTRRSYYPKEFEYEHFERGITYWDSSLVPIIDEGKAYYIIETVSEVTERVEKRKLIEEKEKELLDKAFNASPCLMAISTISDGCYIKVNKCFEESTGFSAVESIGRTSVELDILDITTRKIFAKLLEEQGTLKNIEANYKTQNGGIRVGLFSAEVIVFNGEKCILSVVNDVTELKKLEREISKLERMNLIGQMAASIGHEVRNPMTCVRGFLQLFSEKDELNSYKDYIQLMIEELDRANNIISDFLSLSKNRYTELIKKNINSVISTLAPLIIADGLELNGNVNFNLGTVSDLDLNEEEIRQLILNLTRNGFEAMPEGGLLTITTYNEGADVILSIKDQGKGIEGWVLEDIGTPFFTTKEKGTGLGLAVCYSIAESHCATINLESNNYGTEVIICFKGSNS